MSRDLYADKFARQRSADLLRHYGTIRRYMSHFSRPWCSADDLVQEAYAEAYGSIRNRGPPEKPVPWLLAIATRTAYRLLRRERRHHSHVPEDVIDDRTPEALDELLAREQLVLLRQSLGKLSTIDRDLLDGFYVTEMPCADLGRSYGFSPGAAKTRLHRARQRLKKHYSITDNASGGGST